MPLAHLLVFFSIATVSVCRRVLEKAGPDVAGMAWDDILVAAVVTGALNYLYYL